MATDDSALQARLEEGATLYENGNLYEALVAWKAVLAIDPDNEVAQEYLSFVEENFQIGVDALLAHHEAEMGGAPPLSAPPPEPPPVPLVDSLPPAAPLIPPIVDRPAPAAGVAAPRPPFKVLAPSEPALPLEPMGVDTDAPAGLRAPEGLGASASLEDLPEGPASIENLPQGLPSSSVDVPLFADTSLFMQAPDAPPVRRPSSVEPLVADLPSAAHVDPLAGLDPQAVASNVDAAFDALLAPHDDLADSGLYDPEDDPAPISLPLSSTAFAVPYDDDDDDDDDFGSSDAGDAPMSFEPPVDAPARVTPATSRMFGKPVSSPPASTPPVAPASPPEPTPAVAPGSTRVSPPKRSDSQPLRGTPLDSVERPSRRGPSRSVERPSRSVERPSRSVERPSRRVPSRGADQPVASSAQRGLPGAEAAAPPKDAPRRSRSPEDRAPRRAAPPLASAPLKGKVPVDSIEEMDWSEILEAGVKEGAAPETQQAEGDEAFFIEMQSDRLDVEPGNEAAAWGVSGSPISAPMIQHRSAPTRDPFVMPASHFVDHPDEVFADEPSIPDTWAAEPAEADDLSDGSIDIMVDQDFDSWEEPGAEADPFARSLTSDDDWGAVAEAFDGDEADPDDAPFARAATAPALGGVPRAPAAQPASRLPAVLSGIPTPSKEGARGRTTQELVSTAIPPAPLPAKLGPPPLAHQEPNSLPPLPGGPDDGPVFGLEDARPVSADASDWLSPTFEPQPADAEPEPMGDAFAPPGEADFFALGDDVRAADALELASGGHTLDGYRDDEGLFVGDADESGSLFVGDADESGSLFVGDADESGSLFVEDADESGSLLIETPESIGEAPTLELPDTSALLAAPLPPDPPLPDESPSAAVLGRKRRGGAVDPDALADARRQDRSTRSAPASVAIDPDIEALLRSGFDDLDAIESTGSQSIEVRQRVPSRPANDVNVDALMEQARQKQAAGDFTGSLELVEQVLLVEPNDPRAQAYMQENTSRLLDMYRSRLGALTRMPRVKLRPEEIIWQALDHRAGFLLSQVDGRTSYEDLIEIAGMSELEATRTLARLVGYELIG